MKARHWTIFLVLGLGMASAFGLRQNGSIGKRSSLKLVFEVRDKIHQHYVEEVDSLRMIDAAIDGLVATLPEGENLYLSPAEMAELEPDWVNPRPQLDNRQQIGVLDEVFRRVNQQYVAQVSADTLARGMVWGMLSALDPHSTFLDAEERAEMVERFRGDFEGIGIYFEIRQGRLMVIAPIVGSPADGKLRAGDQIVEIEGISTEGITNEQVMRKLRGPKGSTVRVTVRRQGRPEPFEVTIQRGRIAVRSIPYDFLVRPGIGYLRIVRFAETTSQELSQALQELGNRGMKRLLLDLRGNGGGLLNQAVEVADHFLDQGELVVFTQGRTPESRQEYRDTHPLEGSPLPLIVMIDHGSASASEIVAGAIQDLDRGLVVGQTSFGKGLVQEQFPLASNGGLLLLTVARYYTPLGRLIQRSYTDDLQAYLQEGIDDFDPNAVDSLKKAGPIFYTPLGRTVYGGGGITPDVVLPAEQYSDFEQELFSSGALADFSSRWAGTEEIGNGDPDSFREHYQVPDSVLVAFGRFLAEMGRPIATQVLQTHRDFLRRELKAGIARVLWNDEVAYQIHLEGDLQVQQALKLFDRAEELLVARQAVRRDLLKNGR